MNWTSLRNRNRSGAIALGLAAILLLAASAAPAGAATYYNVDCYCDPKTEAKPLPDFDPSLSDGGTIQNFAPKTGCICGKNFVLPKSGTKEFRFRCKNENAYKIPAYQYIFNLDKPTTCTDVLRWDEMSLGAADYTSASCTNWSPLSTDTVKAQMVCTDETP